MSQESPSKISLLKKRAKALRLARDFFYERDITEVDTPILSRYASIDEHIDLIPATLNGNIPCYLHSSPEYGMKQLLSQGSGDIYQLSHVFRDEESGPRHSHEFTMCEWYRVGIGFEAFIDETLQFIQLFTGKRRIERISYRDLFLRHCQIDPFKANTKEIYAKIEELGLFPYVDLISEDLDAHLNFLLGSFIEPQLPKGQITVLFEYPPSHAALAQVCKKEGIEVAMRFEIYFGDLELANGYHELCDEKEQRKRLIEANEKRVAKGKNSLPLDEPFLRALKNGLPACCGVAVGFDRLCMVNCEQKSLITPKSYQKIM